VDAAAEGNLEAVKSLVSQGADPSGTGKGPTPMSAAYSNGHTEVLLWLLHHGAHMESILEGRNSSLVNHFVYLGQRRADTLDIVKAFLEAGMPALPPGACNPLHHVGSPALAKLLIDAGADPRHEDGTGVAVLHAAIAWRNPELIRVILQAGVDVNASDFNGVTPLLRAVELEAVDVVQVLLEAGASPTPAADRRGRTPMSEAQRLATEPRHEEAGKTTAALLRRGMR
jgi:ankyrin repeat protein